MRAGIYLQCCCRWGAAISGEWPESECPGCPIHQGQFMVDEPCKRHSTDLKGSYLPALNGSL